MPQGNVHPGGQLQILFLLLEKLPPRAPGQNEGTGAAVNRSRSFYGGLTRITGTTAICLRRRKVRRQGVLMAGGAMSRGNAPARWHLQRSPPLSERSRG